MLVILQDFPCNSEYLILVKELESIASNFVFSTHLVNYFHQFSVYRAYHTLNRRGF